MEVTGRGQLLAVCKRNNVGKKPLMAPARCHGLITNNLCQRNRAHTQAGHFVALLANRIVLQALSSAPGDHTATRLVGLWRVDSSWLWIGLRLVIDCLSLIVVL
jgi:hypothetical protein